MFRTDYTHLSSRRCGVSLIEMLIVVTLMGILSSVIVSRYGRTVLGDISSQGDAHRLWLDLQYARRAAIKNGQSCCVVFTGGTSPTGYQLMLGTSAEVASGLGTTVDVPRQLSSDITVSASTAVFEFDFEGHAAGSYTLLLTAPDQRWQVQVVSLTGIATIKKL